MSEQDRMYFANRAAEEEQRASEAKDPLAAQAHRKMQRAYVERASIGERPGADAHIDSGIVG